MAIEASICTGAKGDPGESAYQIAVDNGFVGTEQEWLDSLKGSDGKSAYQSAVDGGYAGTEEQFNIDLSQVGNKADQSELESEILARTEADNQLQENTDNLTERVDEISDQVEINTSDIDGIKKDQAKESHYRGDYKTNAEILALTNNIQGDFAYSVESGTRWAYNTSWGDTDEEWVDTPIPASDEVPLMDGEAMPGSSNSYSRGGHRHPTDTTRAAKSYVDEELAKKANKTSIPTKTSQLQNDSDYTTNAALNQGLATRSDKPLTKKVILASAGWVFDGDAALWKYMIADANITDTAFVDAVVDNASQQYAYNILPQLEVSDINKTITAFSYSQPADITITYTIIQ